MDQIALSSPPLISPYGVRYDSARSGAGIRYYDAKPKKVIVKQEFGQTKVEVDLEKPSESNQEIATVVPEMTAENSSALLVAEKLKEMKTSLEKEASNKVDQKTLEQKREDQNAIIEQDLVAIDLGAIPSQEYFDRQKRSIRQKVVSLLGPIKSMPEYNFKENNLANNRTSIQTPIQRVPGDYVISIQNHDVSFSELGISQVEISEEDRDWLRRAQNYFVSARENNIKIGSAEDYTSMEVLEALWATALHIGIDPHRFIVQLYNESRFNPYVVGSAGEHGIGQFLRSTSDYLGYDWDKMSGGIDTFAYQAKASAEYVKKVGEVAYNGAGPMARAYKGRISSRLSMINQNPSDCIMKNINHCDT